MICSKSSTTAAQSTYKWSTLFFCSANKTARLSPRNEVWSAPGTILLSSNFQSEVSQLTSMAAPPERQCSQESLKNAVPSVKICESGPSFGKALSQILPWTFPFATNNSLSTGKSPKAKTASGWRFTQLMVFLNLLRMSASFSHSNTLWCLLSRHWQRLHLSLATSWENLHKASLVWCLPETMARITPWCLGDLCFKLSEVHWLWKLQMSKCALCCTNLATSWFQAKLRQFFTWRIESCNQSKESPHGCVTIPSRLVTQPAARNANWNANAGLTLALCVVRALAFTK